MIIILFVVNPSAYGKFLRVSFVEGPSIHELQKKGEAKETLSFGLFCWWMQMVFTEKGIDLSIFKDSYIFWLSTFTAPSLDLFYLGFYGGDRRNASLFWEKA